MSDNLYLLEVFRFNVNSEDAKLEHVGYIKKFFRTKNEACSYYDLHNPHLRKLNAHNTYKSDWDPETKLMYVVRKNYGIICNIEPFIEKI